MQVKTNAKLAVTIIGLVMKYNIHGEIETLKVFLTDFSPNSQIHFA
jgi:hypothetical protein